MEDCTEETNKPHIGYKRASGHLVTLEIIGQNNEGREGIDRLRAKHRTARARVLSITDCGNELKTYEEATSDVDFYFDYRVGREAVPVQKYDPNVDRICGSGIHYFLTKDLAIDYYPVTTLGTGPPYPNATRVVQQWSDNGKTLELNLPFRNGLLHGECIDYKGLTKRWQCFFVNGKRQGSEKLWDHRNGKLIFHYIFDDGKKIEEVKDIYPDVY